MTSVVDVVVLAYGDEPWLARCVEAILRSTDVSPRVVVVDNGASDAVAGLSEDPHLVVLRPGSNTGFSGGCNLGAASGGADVVVFVNSDVVVEPTALRALCGRLEDPAVGLATGCLLLMDDAFRSGTGDPAQARVNSSGNPVHWAGFSWCGGFGEPRSAHLEPATVASVSGGLFGARRSTWTALGGFAEDFFAYHEDVDLSLRSWIRGLAVVYEPGAVGWHDYVFSRNPHKAFLVERNRLLTWLTVPSARTWLRLAVPFLVVQVLALGKAILAGDGLAWLRAAGWVVLHPGRVARRRRIVQRGRLLPDTVWLALTQRRLAPPSETGVTVPAPINAMLELLSSAVRPRAVASCQN